MSGIFGTYHRDKRPASQELWERLGKITAHRGTDGTTIQPHGSVLFGHNTLCTTTESLREKLPYFCETSSLAITADARLDNRTELFHALDITEQDAPLASDSKIILLAYAKWGKGSFCRLLGDFSFVIWDSKKKKMVAVRDSLGVKPFYYSLSDRLFSFNSEIKPLVMHPGVSGVPNEAMIGEYLAAKIVSKTETLYRDILRLAPGHSITVTPEKAFIQQYWKPNFDHQLHYREERDYVEHFQELFAEAIRCRTRSHLPISFELSGGLDSSSIVGMAQTMPAADNRNNFSICSLIYPGRACDEKQYIEKVEKHLGISVKYIDISHSQGSNWYKQDPRACTVLDPPNLSNSEPLLKYVQQNNSRVLLTGIGGDEWFTGSDYVYLDQLLEKKYGAMAHDLKRNFRENRKTTCKKLAANFIWPFLPFFVKTAVIKKTRSHSLYPPWIPSTFARKINLQQRLLRGFAEPYVTNLAHTDLFALFHTGYESNVLEKNDAQRARYQIEGRHPFLDRRIIEFALSLPNSLHRQNGRSKYLLRRAGNNYLPATIRNRNSKAEFSQLYYHTFTSKSFADTLKNSKIYANGWIDKQSLHDAHQNNLHCFFKNPAGPCPDTLAIWFAFAISNWYNNAHQY